MNFGKREEILLRLEKFGKKDGREREGDDDGMWCGISITHFVTSRKELYKIPVERSFPKLRSIPRTNLEVP